VNILAPDEFFPLPLIRSQREPVGGGQPGIRDIRLEEVSQAVLWYCFDVNANAPPAAFILASISRSSLRSSDIIEPKYLNFFTNGMVPPSMQRWLVSATSYDVLDRGKYSASVFDGLLFLPT